MRFGERNERGSNNSRMSPSLIFVFALSVVSNSMICFVGTPSEWFDVQWDLGFIVSWFAALNRNAALNQDQDRSITSCMELHSENATLTS